MSAWLVVLLFCCRVGVCEEVGLLGSMKLLRAGTGWAATPTHLFWTSSGGQEWKDITPKAKNALQRIASVFFLDTSTGWVLLACADQADEAKDDTCFEVAATTNAGGSWLLVHPVITDPSPVAGLSGRGWINFADRQHGWLLLKVATNLAFSWGVMLRTKDGGRTWEGLPTPPAAEEFRFLTATEGWMARAGDLYVSRDAGTSWRPVTLPPKSFPVRVWGSCPDAPSAFGKAVLLPVRYELVPDDESRASSTIVLFASTDRGRTWKEDGRISGLPDNFGPDMAYPSAIASSALITVFEDQKGKLILQTLHDGNTARTTSSNVTTSQHGPVSPLSFTDPNHGWIMVDGRLLTTSDGGTTWSEITPRDVPRWLPNPVNP